MSLCRAIKSVFTRAGHWIQETYCALGQTVAEQIETASDAIAEKQYLAGRPPSRTRRQSLCPIDRSSSLASHHQRP